MHKQAPTGATCILSHQRSGLIVFNLCVVHVWRTYVCGTGACTWYVHVWYLAHLHVCARHDLRLMHTAGAAMPLKFQLTNQDSAGGKNLAVLTSWH